eukprot:TRINITY_DN8983_c1_g1_i1.p1 TRINITY_DN8983_c1_g1~~TRINITY_DN8983_c1_g1_i1.p1  ORF type:complete len:814 (-),score=164.33 TRINITY_DN8983_c1_g1_i1:165-2606(-)
MEDVNFEAFSVEQKPQQPPPPPPPPPPTTNVDDDVYKPWEDANLRGAVGIASPSQDFAAAPFSDDATEKAATELLFGGSLSSQPAQPSQTDFLLGGAFSSEPAQPSNADLLLGGGLSSEPAQPSQTDLLVGGGLSSKPAQSSRILPGTAELLFGDDLGGNQPPPARSVIPTANLLSEDEPAGPAADPDFSDLLMGPLTNNAASHGSRQDPRPSDTRAEQGGGQGLSLIDLGESSASEAGGGESAFLRGPPSQPQGFIDLSGSSSKKPPSQQAQAKAKSKASGKAKAAPKRIPQNAQAFGSDDLFGRAEGERSMQDDAADALGAVYQMLPDQVKQHLPAPNSCLAVSTANDTEVVIQEEEEEPADEPAGNAALPGANITGGLRGPVTGGALEEEHIANTVSRSTQGRWVPTYMRHQLAAGGHTTMPTAVNAHEYSAGQAPPPTLGQTFMEMGQEIGEGAQAIVEFVAAFFDSFSAQCQVCSHHAVSTAHEHVISCGGGLCGAADDEEIVLGPLASEAAMGLGPIRSRVKRDLPGVSFETLLEMARVRFAGRQAPAELTRFVRSRDLGRQEVSDPGVEDWLLFTEVNIDLVPADFRTHICQSHGPMGLFPLKCEERWHVDRHQTRAQVEISTASVGAFVHVVLRMDINGLSSDGTSGSSGCEVDSRLFLKSRDLNAPLPRGIVEELTEVHHLVSEGLRDMVLSFSAVADPQPQAQSAFNLPQSMAQQAVQEPEPEAGLGGGLDLPEQAASPVVKWPLARDRMPSWAVDGPAEKRDDGAVGAGASGRPPAAKDATNPAADKAAVDKDLLMKFASAV